MKGILKWLVIISLAGAVVFAVAAVILVYTIDIKQYQPKIEQIVAENTGRPFSMGDEMDLSLFPWVGVELADLRLGNPEGFSSKEMVSIKRFEARLKVMPLLSKKIEVKTFVLEEPQIYLEKLKDGRVNWSGIGKARKPGEKEVEKEPVPEKAPAKDSALPIEGLLVGNFSITGGRLIYKDQAAGETREISGMNLTLANVSLENPIDLSMGAIVDGKPFSMEGRIGPLGKDPGKSDIALDLIIKAVEQLELGLAGRIIDPTGTPGVDLKINLEKFSPRKLLQALDIPLPVQTADPAVLDALSFAAQLKGSQSEAVVNNGVLVVDDSKIEFSASAAEFKRPALAFDIRLDRMDLDRYLPAPSPEDKSGKKEMPEKGADDGGKAKQTDYTPLRSLLLDGSIQAGRLKAHGAVLENLEVKINAENGIVSMDPVKADLYNGEFVSALVLNVQKQQPRSTVKATAKGIQAGPLLKDAMKKELIEGALNMDINLSVTGDKPDVIKQTLSGNGQMLFVDGAVVGIDLANAVRNVKVNLGLAEQLDQKPRTDFAELKVPFTAANGVVNTPGSSLVSPLIRVLVKGDINLVRELLDLRVDPKFVATLKGQGDTKERSGLMVPVLITGPFTGPKVRPDLKGMIGSGAVPGTADIQKVLGSKDDQEKKLESVKEDVKKQVESLIPGLFN